MVPRIVYGEFGWFRFLVVCFLYKTNPDPRKIICCVKKSPNCHVQPNLSWVGLALGWEVRWFHNNIYYFEVYVFQPKRIW